MTHVVRTRKVATRADACDSGLVFRLPDAVALLGLLQRVCPSAPGSRLCVADNQATERLFGILLRPPGDATPVMVLSRPLHLIWTMNGAQSVLLTFWGLRFPERHGDFSTLFELLTPAYHSVLVGRVREPSAAMVRLVLERMRMQSFDPDGVTARACTMFAWLSHLGHNMVRVQRLDTWQRAAVVGSVDVSTIPLAHAEKTARALPYTFLHGGVLRSGAPSMKRSLVVDWATVGARDTGGGGGTPPTSELVIVARPSHGTLAIVLDIIRVWVAETRRTVHLESVFGGGATPTLSERHLLNQIRGDRDDTGVWSYRDLLAMAMQRVTNQKKLARDVTDTVVLGPPHQARAAPALHIEFPAQISDLLLDTGCSGARTHAITLTYEEVAPETMLESEVGVGADVDADADNDADTGDMDLF